MRNRKASVIERFVTSMQNYQRAYRLSARDVFAQSTQIEGQDSLSAGQMRLLILHMVPNALPDELEFLVTLLDSNVDGSLSSSEFVSLVEKLSAVRSYQ